METFEIIKETEKAIKVKYPYYEKTSEYKKSHIQKFIEQWIPKSVKNIEQFIKAEMQNRGFSMFKIELGIAPVKNRIEDLLIPDSEKIKEKVDELRNKIFAETGINTTYNSLINDEGYYSVNGEDFDFSKEVEDLINYKPVIKIKQYK